MKSQFTSRSIASVLLVCLLLGTLPTGCKKSDDPAAGQVSCRVETVKNEAGTVTSTYSYNAAGQLTKLAYSSGARNEYVYDGDGYLQTLTYYGSTGTVTQVTSYAYTNGRMASATNKSAAGAVLNSTAYEYDGSSAALTRVTISYSSSERDTYTYANGKQTGYTYRSASGSESQPYTFDDGLVKRYVSGTSQTNYEYDAQGRRTRIESLTSGRVTGYAVYEYTDGRMHTETVPLAKGMPEALRYGVNNTGSSSGLINKVAGYTTPTTGSTYKSYDYSYTYSKNTANLPLERNYVYREYSTTGGTTYTSAAKNSYTYLGCP